MTALDTTRIPLNRITVTPKRGTLDAHGHAVLRDIHEMGQPHVEAVSSARLVLIESPFDHDTLKRVARTLLADPVTEEYDLRTGGDDASLPGSGFDAAIEVHLKGGVMDPVAGSALMVMTDLGLEVSNVRVSTGRLYRLQGVRDRDEALLIARRLLANDCIEDVYLSGFSHHDPRPDHLPIAPAREFALRTIALRELDDEALARLSRDAHLFLSLPEIRAVQNYYQTLERDPTDLELEMFAQTWSEHCVHKTLKSKVRYRGAALPPMSADRGDTQEQGGQSERVYDNLLKETVARATHELIASGRADWCLSVFEDNAGVIAFDDDYGIAFKVETHNHPSAIEPYGGAATGVGGCVRDIMGCGLGAKPIANTDVFCFAEPEFPLAELPKGVLHPRRIFKGVVSGVRDYGNRMGIPTVNGGIVFDNRYLGNPLVFCGCVGLIPRRCIHKEPQPGDYVVVLGGRTGRDGIHGATFSSAELTDTHADEFSHAVQIGDAITEKKVLDAMLRARDHESGCLYTATTDCGAGGLSSAVGEMAEKLGAEVDLDTVPLKYAGLRYDEIWISEAQERMVLSVPPANWPAVEAICRAESVEATIIGRFRDDGRLIIRYAGQVVGDLDTRFLHAGPPGTQREATWSPPSKEQMAKPGQTDEPNEPLERLRGRLSSLNGCSKECVIRQYDHEVQGASVVKPLVGPGQGPSDAAVIRPRLGHGKGLAIANGIAPSLADEDPYWMAVAGIDEAIRNAVCVGGSPERTAILDNFCWGNCDDPQTMGGLVRACQGCYDAATAYGTPFISGKDSLNNEFALDGADAERLHGRIALFNGRIRIPSTLLISAISIVEDVQYCVTMDVKAKPDARLHFVGLPDPVWTTVNLGQAADLHRKVASVIATGDVLAAHDVGHDGILTALAEMAIAGQCGLDVDGDRLEPFKPVTSGYILQLRSTGSDALAPFHEAGFDVRPVAQPCETTQFRVHGATPEFSTPVASLAEAWRQRLHW